MHFNNFCSQNFRFESYSTKSKQLTFFPNLKSIFFKVDLSTNSNADGWVSAIPTQFLAAIDFDLYSMIKRSFLDGIFFRFSFADNMIPSVPSDPINSLWVSLIEPTESNLYPQEFLETLGN